MSLGFLFAALQTVPTASLQRDLRFSYLALGEAAQAAILAVSTMLLAWFGFRYWALVSGNLLATCAGTMIILAARRFRFTIPRYGELADAITLSRHIFFSRVTWYIQTNADFLVAGRVLGQRDLGTYSIGWTIASIPVKISALFARVLPAVFSAVQTDLATMRRYFLLMTEVLAIITVPLAIGLALTADDSVPLLLGTQWVAAVRPLQIIVGFLVGSRWGTVGIASAWILIYPVLVLPLYWVVFRRIELTTRQYLRAIAPAFLSALIMAAAVLSVKHPSIAPSHLAVRLALQVILGATIYVGSLMVMYPTRVLTVVQFVRTLRTRATVRAL
jgi:O-antigen/teichoic acid export membrane protein